MYTYAKKENTKKNLENANKGMVRKRNQTGIPDQIKNSLELFSGFSLDDVRVHYHSNKPDKLQAFAYTQGNQIYLGAGHENSLPHELGHVIQQKQGRVHVTPNAAGLPVNLERELEEEADWIGTMAARGWIRPQSANLQTGSSAIPAVPVIQMDYQTKFEDTKAKILQLLKGKKIIGLSEWGAERFTWHHIFPKTFLLEDQKLKFLAEHSDLLSLGPAPEFRMDDPGSAGLDYDYMPYGEGKRPELTPVSEQLRQLETTNLENMQTSLLQVKLESDDKNKHLEIERRWAQWFIPSERLVSMFGEDLAPEFAPYLRNYKVYQSRTIDGREQEIEDIRGLPLLSLNETTLGKKLYAEIQSRYHKREDLAQAGGTEKVMFYKALRRGSQGPALNPAEREIEHKRQLITLPFIQEIVGKLEPLQKKALRQHGYAVPRILQDIERYLIQYGIDIRPKTAGLTLETIKDLDISDQFKSFQKKVHSLIESKNISDQFQWRKWFLEEQITQDLNEPVIIGEDPISGSLRSLFKLLEENKDPAIAFRQEIEEEDQEEVQRSAGKRKQKKARQNTQSERTSAKHGRKRGKQKPQPEPRKGKHGQKTKAQSAAKPQVKDVEIDEMSIEKLLDVWEGESKVEIDLGLLKLLFKPDQKVEELQRRMMQTFFEHTTEPVYQLLDEMLEEQEEEMDEELSFAAQQLVDSYSDIHPDKELGYQGMGQTEVISEKLQGLMVSDLASAQIRNILLYRAGIMDYYHNLWTFSIGEDQIKAYFKKIQEVVAGKIHKVTVEKQPEPRMEELLTAAWNIARQVVINIGESNQDYLARVKAAILQVVQPIVQKTQAEED